jgi:SAM-dependent methyltransferase
MTPASAVATNAVGSDSGARGHNRRNGTYFGSTKVGAVNDPGEIDLEVLLSRFTPPDKKVQAESFGGVASDYERYRPGPPAAAIDWILPARVARIVDLGAGTRASTRPLMGRADEIVAVEPDDRMRSVLVHDVPGARAVKGRGESMPIPDHSADAVLASASWHWMDPLPTFREVARVLVPGGTFGVLWSVPDPEGSLLSRARALLANQPLGDRDAALAGDRETILSRNEFSNVIAGDAYRSLVAFEVPPGVPFAQPEHEAFTWDVALNANEMIGLLGTWPWVITLPDDTRARLFAEARRILREVLGVDGAVTVDVTFRCDAWRTRQSAP